MAVVQMRAQAVRPPSLSLAESELIDRSDRTDRSNSDAATALSLRALRPGNRPASHGDRGVTMVTKTRLALRHLPVQVGSRKADETIAESIPASHNGATHVIRGAARTLAWTRMIRLPSSS